MLTTRRTWLVLVLTGLVFLGMLAITHLAANPTDQAQPPVVTATPSDVEPPQAEVTGTPSGASSPSASVTPSTAVPTQAKTLPGGRDRIFEDKRVLVAYYGSARTSALGVLGEASPDRIVRRLKAAAKPFARPGSKVQIVFELIVTIADATPGPDGDYNHDIRRADVQRYIDAAHRHGALLLLDIQPGRAGFLSVAKRWGWALKDPFVGLALDPEWRMDRRSVPGQRIGSVGPREVNRVSAWLRDLIRRHDLPQKLFVLHQFRPDMLPGIEDIAPRTGLVMVQHVDGFGTPGQKLDTFDTVVRPRQFFLGFKLFYDEDVRLMRPREVRAIRPRVQFVSYQ